MTVTGTGSPGTLGLAPDAGRRGRLGGRRPPLVHGLEVRQLDLPVRVELGRVPVPVERLGLGGQAGPLSGTIDSDSGHARARPAVRALPGLASEPRLLRATPSRSPLAELEF